jgi:hypothetical protein
MNKTLPKRGRPPKRNDSRKADYLDIRLLTVEKRAFRDAADLAGLDLSAWVRERLRMLARKELEAAGRSVAFLKQSRNDVEHLIEARYVRPAKIFLLFADGFAASLPIKALEIPVNRMRWSTLKVAQSGEKVIMKGIKGDLVPIDATTLRYLVDKDYAAKMDKSLESLQFSREELAELARNNPPPREWYDEPADDLTRESWK